MSDLSSECSVRARSGFVAPLLVGVLMAGLFSPHLQAQRSEAAIQGTITDSSGAVIAGATITITSTETGLQRAETSDSAGLYVAPNLPPGGYRVRVSMAGFQTNVRENLDLVVGQQYVLNVSLQAGQITQEVNVNEEAPVVDTSVSQITGVVGERQVKDLPLNGRSVDNLITLNPAAINSTSLQKPGPNVGNSAGNVFSVAGQRPGETVFLWNGVEYIGAGGVDQSTPGGVSGQLLGVDAVREFNMVTNIDSADYGHRPGGQINIVTASGSNRVHGTLFEFLRNSDLDARNFFDQAQIAPFKRNQFGGAIGGPIKKDKTFIFGNYEGYRQRLGISAVAVVPDNEARLGMLPVNGVYTPVAGFNPAVLPYLALWPVPNGPELLVKGLPTGVAESFSNPANPIREDFGNLRVDHNFSERDTLSVVYTIDDGWSVTPSSTNQYTTTVADMRDQVISLTETHIFSANTVNTFTAGYTRPHMVLTSPTTVMPPGAVSFYASPAGWPLGDFKIGAQQGISAFSGAGAVSNSATFETLNNFSYQDQVHINKGIHSLAFGVWALRLQWQDTAPFYGLASFTSLTTLLQGTIASISATKFNAYNPWRVWEGAWFVQDTIKLRPNLTVNLGLRHEFTNGFNNNNNIAANWIPDANGVLLTQPRIGSSLFTQNNQKLLFSPRAGIAWDPFGNGKTAIRAGFGMAYNFVDDIGNFALSSNPAYASYTVTGATLPFQVSSTGQFPAGTTAVVGGNANGAGIQPNPYAAAVINWRFDIQREILPGMSLTLEYLGSHGYHELLRADRNPAVSVICSVAAANCPAGLSDGTKYYPLGSPFENPALGDLPGLYTEAVSSYQAITVDLNRRFRSGLALRANYAFAKSLDDASFLTGGTTNNQPTATMNPTAPLEDYGLSGFNVSNHFNFSGSYELPFGSGKPFLGGAKGLENKLVSGWQLNTIVALQSGFPLTPQLGFSQSRDGNGGAGDRPNWAPGMTTSDVYVRTQQQWYNPAAFVVPVAGTYGDVGRNVLIGPGLSATNLSLFKTIRFSERIGLEFRAEVFNLFNHTNLGSPSLIPLTSSGAISPTAGLISSTATTSRQIQFGVKLRW